MTENVKIAKVTHWVSAAVIVVASTQVMAQDVTPHALSKEEIEAIVAKERAHVPEMEAELKFFRDESDAVRAAAGDARAPAVEDCALQVTIVATSYVCPARALARNPFKTALLSRGWIAMPAPTQDSPYAVDAFRKGITLAYFVCAPGRKDCVLELKRLTH